MPCNSRELVDHLSTLSKDAFIDARHRTHEQSQIPCDPRGQNADVVESTKLRCKKGLSALKAMASKGIEQRHLFLLYQNVILSVIDYGLGLTTLSQSNLLKLDRVQNEAMRVILGTTKDTPMRPCATYWTCHPWKQDIRWSKSKRISMQCRIPRIHCTMLSKKKRGGDWQEASHRWAKQDNQSSICAVSQSSSM